MPPAVLHTELVEDRTSGLSVVLGSQSDIVRRNLTLEISQGTTGLILRIITDHQLQGKFPDLEVPLKPTAAELSGVVENCQTIGGPRWSIDMRSSRIVWTP